MKANIFHTSTAERFLIKTKVGLTRAASTQPQCYLVQMGNQSERFVPSDEDERHVGLMCCWTLQLKIPRQLKIKETEISKPSWQDCHEGIHKSITTYEQTLKYH